MRKSIGFFRATIAGGILFLIPVIVIAWVIGRAIGFLHDLAKPIADLIPLTRVAGVGVLTLISIILLLLICFLAGIFMRTRLAKALVKWLEERVLVYLPGYAYIHARSSEWFSDQSTSNWKPATVFIDDNEVLCFVTDETSDYCSIFVPDAPSPSSGNVSVRAKALVTLLPISVSEAVSMIRQFGKNAASLMQKVKPNPATELR